jgi:glycosyltransferase involved in cell wall biosynthesis
VIGSDSGAIPDVVDAGGLIVPERNPAALADAIQALMRYPQRAAALGQTGRAQVLRQFTWGAVAAQMHGIYQQLLSPAPERRAVSAT